MADGLSDRPDVDVLLGKFAPIEPTQEMVRAVYQEQPGAINAGFAQAYRAMISAAPTRDGAEGVGFTVSDEDWDVALGTAYSCIKAPSISLADFDNAMQHAFGILSLRKIAAPPKPAPDAIAKAEELFQLMEDECWTLKCQSYPGMDDSDIGWEVIEYHQAKPHERLVAQGSTPIEAMKSAALARPLYAARAHAVVALSAPAPPASIHNAHDDIARGISHGEGEAVPLDPTNHHNALKCPYCNPQGLSFAPPCAGAAEPVAKICHRGIFKVDSDQ